jgi:predicted alpha/beta superfamily hydrolase
VKNKSLKKIYLLSFIFLFACCFKTLAQNLHVSIHVIVPRNTPKNDSLLVVGNDKKFGEWIYPNSARMTHVKDSLWAYDSDFPKNTFLSFKILRGSWFHEATYNNSLNGMTFSFTVSHDTSVTISPSNWNDLLVRSITGTVNYYHNLYSPEMKYPRDVIIWLPPSYFKNTDKRYPVLYMHDGQNLMDASTSGFGTDWRVDKVSDSLIRSGAVEEYIVVGIYNSPNRWVEYSGDDEGKMYADFIVHTLKPMIDKQYRTKPDRDNTAIMGSSMGGNISFYFLLWYPDIFSKAASLSGGFAYDEGNILKKIDTLKLPLQHLSLYLDCGDQGLDKYFGISNEWLYQQLKNKNFYNVVYYPVPDADHNEFAWSHRLWKPLEFLFGNNAVH